MLYLFDTMLVSSSVMELFYIHGSINQYMRSYLNRYANEKRPICEILVVYITK